MKNRVRQLRKERKMLQEDLAGKLNVSQQTISRIESGDYSLPADILVGLSTFFGVSVDYILYLSETRRTPEFQIELNTVTEKNYRLCRLYEALDPANQEMVYKLTEHLNKLQTSKRPRQ